MAGRGRGPAQSSARAPAISRNATQAPGPASAAAPPWREAMARFERHGSDLAARPDVAWGPTADPEGSCGTRPPGNGGPKLEVQHGPAPSPARRQWMRHSGGCTRTLECTAHCPDGDRPSGPIQTQSPHLHRVSERVPRIAHAAVGCAILVQGYCSRSTGRHAREPPLVRAVVVVSMDGSTQV